MNEATSNTDQRFMLNRSLYEDIGGGSFAFISIPSTLVGLLLRVVLELVAFNRRFPRMFTNSQL